MECEHTSQYYCQCPNSKAADLPPTLVYYSIRGLAQPIRILLCLLGVEFKEVSLNKKVYPKDQAASQGKPDSCFALDLIEANKRLIGYDKSSSDNDLPVEIVAQLAIDTKRKTITRVSNSTLKLMKGSSSEVSLTGLEANNPLSLKIDLHCLPYLIHKSRVIVDVMPIIFYLCKLYGKTELLGKMPQDKARIHELLAKWSERKSKTFMILLEGVRQLTNQPVDRSQLDQLREKILREMVQESKFIEPVMKYKQTNHPNQPYIMGYLTIVDIVFYDHSFYITSLCSSLEKALSPCSAFRFCQPVKKQAQDAAIQTCLKVVRESKQFLESEPFYKLNLTYLNLYSVRCNKSEPKYDEAFSAIWLGDPKFLKPFQFQ